MSRICSVCLLATRQAVDLALLCHAASYRRIATQYGVTEAALRRHERTHLGMSWQQSKELAAMLSAENLLDELSKLHDEVWALLHDAKQHGDVQRALAAVREARCLVDSFAHVRALTGQEQDRDTARQADRERQARLAALTRQPRMVNDPVWERICRDRDHGYAGTPLHHLVENEENDE